MSDIKIVDVKAEVIDANDSRADEVRRYLKENNTFLINLMASPGAGKTTTLTRTLSALKGRYKIGVLEADMDSDVDAKTIDELGVKVIELHTGGSCHMDAVMTLDGLKNLGISDLDIVILENVGNLVCPAEFDVGADLRVMILSVPEGDDKPLKYPLMFSVSDILLVNKIDALEVFDFDIDKLKSNVRPLNEDMKIYPLSALTGEGFDAWIDELAAIIDKTIINQG